MPGTETLTLLLLKAPPPLDLEPEIWGKLPFEVKAIILAEWLQGAATRVLRQSQVRQRALALAAVANADVRLALS